MDYDIQGTENLSFEHRRSSFDFANNYIGLSNIPISYFIKKTDHDWRTIFSLRDYVTGYSVWNGSASTDWETAANWTPAAVPTAVSNVIIPDISTTLYQCVLAPDKTVNTMTIENGGALTMGSNTLTVQNSLSGGWEDQNMLGNNPGTSKVVFSTPGTSLSGTTRFYDVEIGTDADITNQAASTMKIANTITRTGAGKWYADMNNTTIEYNGAAQTVALPDGTKHYHNLTLSGSGIKTLPVAPLAMNGNFSLQGTASTSITDSVYVGANVSLANGTSITILPTKILNVAGSISNNAGANGLLIKSNSTQANGSLIYHNAYSAPVQAKVEMYSKASKPSTSSKWQFFGIPVRSMNLLPYFYGSYVRKLNEPGVGGGGLEPTRLWVQLTDYSVINSFAGYEVTQVTPTTFTFSGELENRDYDSGILSYTTGADYPGQHLIANSYTAAIDISKIEFGSADPTVIENTVYLYNTGSKEDWLAASPPAIEESNVAGQYIAIPKNVANRGLGIPSQIPSMQAFLVKVKKVDVGGITWVKIPYSATGTMVKNTTLQRAPSINVSTRIEMKATKYSDFVWLFTEPSCSSGFENGWDGFKNNGSTAAPQLFAVEAIGNLQVDSKDDIDKTTLAFLAPKDQIYSLIFTHQNLQTRYESLYLFDVQENKYIDITESGKKYDFYATKSTTAVERFKIVKTPGVTTDNINSQALDIQIYSSGNTIHIINLTKYFGKLNLYDLSGRLVLQKQIEPQSNTSNTVSFETGLYIAKVTDESNSVVASKTLKIDSYKK